MEASATFTARTSDRLRRIGRAVVDSVLPPRCLSCGEIVEQPDALCSRCWSGIAFFAPPWCVLCGLPFPHPMGEDAVCADCARERPSWDQARAVLRYDKNSRRLVLGFKHGDHTHSAAAFGRWMQRAGADLLARADLLVPVPLHWTRLFQRRYNQAALLAQAVHSAGGPEVAADWLVRRRRTPVQGHLGPAARERNVRGAFAMRPRRSVAGKHVVIIDDVMTTGATVGECARVLKHEGALSVGVLTLARALRTGA
jgi:ComF family protein